ncbi:MAG: HD domain-containing protein [Eubacteriales bacterium]|nr:HD domain-containing protein [Eubacteriales bacterium]
MERIYQGAHIQRWNDHIRPKGFTELDKQSQKMIIAYILGSYEEQDKNISVDWRKLIEGGIFEYLHRIILTDIKPPVYHKLMNERGREINKWVYEQLGDDLQSIKGDFFEKFKEYFDNPSYAALEKKILKASHYLSTNWEFKIIYPMNSVIYGIEETKKAIENELEEHYDLAGVQKIKLGNKTSDLIDLIGQLRFQQRWAQSPRVPETSVMGHMLIVAIMSYLCSLEIEACNQRLCNNYFTALFHDIPEVLTRDIISPVKRSVDGLDDIIKEIEKKQMDEKFFPLLPENWHEKIRFYIEDEFAGKIIDNGKLLNVTSDEINKKYNFDKYNPVDGQIIKGCDHLAAFIEARISISHGITSVHLDKGSESIGLDYKNKNIAGIDFAQLFDYFK